MAEKKTITVFGGTGFVGRNLISKIAKKGFKIIVPTRNPYLHGYLKPLGEPGQIQVTKFNFSDLDNLTSLVKDSEYVVNCIGILYENKNQTFNNLHHLFPKFLSSILNKEITKRFIHVSALGVNEESNSFYIKSKLNGEKAVTKNFENSVILRPSIIFGVDDNFFNLFNKLINLLPVIPLVGGQSKFQPCYVGDVTDSIVNIIDNYKISNGIYELGGPNVYSFKELIEVLLKQLDKKRLIVELPEFIATIQARIMQLFPKPLLTIDQIEILKSDNISTGNFLSFSQLNIQPHSVEMILPNYIFNKVRI
jgi:NADH dehydrogenase